MPEFPLIDMVVNDAVPKEGQALGALADETVQKVIQGYLVGALNVTYPAWCHMIVLDCGRVGMTQPQAIFGIPRIGRSAVPRVEFLEPSAVFLKRLAAAHGIDSEPGFGPFAKA